MLLTKAHGHHPLILDFFKFLPYMGIAAIFVMWPRPVIFTLSHLMDALYEISVQL